ncbi:MFS transporter [Achromobacter marplatensis]|uniref:MFS transporter n=1 Tax=Achromobacter marplatensis TaxID=470868 RepID=A0AA43B0F4_9BURK|nr:MFS transporter [Achromobacter marplatensis]MDH2050810.1 MFS transporter [Achromobacter marplatensis]
MNSSPLVSARSSLPVMACLSVSMLLPALGASVANVALPTLAQAFDAPFHALQWVVLAYLLAVTTLIVSVGRLGDLIGRRRLMLAGIGVFTVASALCGATPWLGGLIAARALQGLGAAIMMALTMAYASDAVAREKTGSVMGLLGTMSAIGTALGPSLGGLLLAGSGWSSIFLINVPLGALAFGLAWFHLPADPSGSGRPQATFDMRGSLLLAAGIAAYALAMTGAVGGGWMIGALLSAAGGLAIAFVRVQATSASPLIRLALFGHPVLSAGVAANGLVSTVMMTTLVVGPFYLAGALGLDAARVGLVMSCGPAVAALAGVPAGRGVDRYGAQRVMRVALAVMVAGVALLSLAPVAFGALGYVAPLAVTTAGYALFQAANSSAVMQCAGADQRGALSGLLNLSRNLGFITGASLMGAVFAWASGAGDLRIASPAALAAGMGWTYALAAVMLMLALVIIVRGRV